VHDQLSGAVGEGDQRQLRHHRGPDDDRARVHRHPEDRRRTVQQGPCMSQRRCRLHKLPAYVVITSSTVYVFEILISAGFNHTQICREKEISQT